MPTDFLSTRSVSPIVAPPMCSVQLVLRHLQRPNHSIYCDCRVALGYTLIFFFVIQSTTIKYRNRLGTDFYYYVYSLPGIPQESEFL